MPEESALSLTIIVPLFNGATTVADTLGSVLRSIKYLQSNSDSSSICRLIVVDDCSTDGGKEVVESLRKDNSEICEILLIRNKQNLGVVASRLEGLRIAERSIIHMLDQDDIVAPNFYVAAVKEIESKTAVVIAGNLIDGRNRIISKANTRTLARFSAQAMKARLNRINTYVFGGNPITSPGSVVFHSSFRDDLLLFYERVAGAGRFDGVDDGMLYPFLLNKGYRFTFIKDCLFSYRMHSSNQSVSLGRKTMHANSGKLMDELFKIGFLSEHQYEGMKRRNSLMQGFYSRHGLDKYFWLLRNLRTTFRKILFKYL